MGVFVGLNNTSFSLLGNNLATSNEEQHRIAESFYLRCLAVGVVLTETERKALSYLCWEYEKNGFLGRETARYPFVGANIESFKLNLWDNTFTLTPVSVTPAMCTANGFLGDGTSAYWSVGAFSSAFANANNHNLSCYARTVGSGAVFMGGNNTGTGGTLRILANSGSILSFSCMSSANSDLSHGNNSYLGYKSCSRLNGNTVSLASNARIQSFTNVRTGSLGGIFLLSGGSTSFSPQLSARQYTMFAFGLSFTENEEMIRYRINQNFETMLGRAV